MPRTKVDDPRSRESGASRTGHRQQQSKAGFLTSADAEAAMSEALEARRKGPLTKPSKLTVGAYLEDWLAGQPLDDPARSAVEAILRNHIGPRIGHLLLQDLQATNLRELNAGLLKDGNQRTGGPLEPATVKKIDGVISRALEAAVPEHIPSNPAHRAFGRQCNWPQTMNSASMRSPAATWGPVDIATFVLAIANRPDHALWRLYAATGARRNEVLCLTWGDVSGRAVVLGRQRTLASHHGYARKVSMKWRRHVELDARTIAALAKHRARQGHRLATLGKAQTSDTPVFDRGDGRPLHPDVVSRQFKRLVEDLGLPPITLRWLRQSVISAWVTSGEDVPTVREWAGRGPTRTPTVALAMLGWTPRPGPIPAPEQSARPRQ